MLYLPSGTVALFARPRGTKKRRTSRATAGRGAGEADNRVRRRTTRTPKRGLKNGAKGVLPFDPLGIWLWPPLYLVFTTKDFQVSKLLGFVALF
jgi:hypothetical protein